ncbi:MAG: diguanylate cyclase [Xanthomonadales bacterium]|nr:diguanylate cyclase [Xanthomonadales bacterium]
MPRPARIAVLAWLLGVFAPTLPAATEYTVAEGLSQNSALALARDGDGFLWIGTEDGLNRFDGYEFRVYRPSDHDPGATAAAYIRDIVVDGRHLFLATNGGGVGIYDRHTERFRTIGIADGLPADHYNALDRIGPGTLYLASRTGLARIDWRGDPMRAEFAVRRIEVGSDPPRTDIWTLRRGPGGLWVGSGDGLFRVDAADRVHPVDVPGAESPFNVDALLEAPAGVLWIGTWNHGLFRIELADRQVRRFLPGTADAPGLRTRRIMSLAAGPGGSVYVGTERGLTWYDPGCDCLKALDHVRSARVAGRGFLVEALDVDERGGVFAGQWGEGLVRFTPSDLIFHVERDRDEGLPGLAQGRVRAVLEDRRGDLWVGSFGGGVQRAAAAVRREGIEWPFEALPFPAGTPEAARLVWNLQQDRVGRIWAATDNGLYWTLPEDPSWRPEPQPPPPQRSGGTRVLLQDSRGRLWVGSSAGLWRIDAFGQPRRPVPLVRPGEDPQYVQQDRSGYALHEDAEQRLWVGTSAGLHILDPEGVSLARHRVGPGRLPGSIVWDIHRHTDGHLFIGSNGGLVRVLDADRPDALRFDPLGRLAGLPSGMVYAIASDRSGHLWLTTNRGLIRFDPASLQHRIWRRRHGIASDEFASGAVAAGSQGWLYFGGIDGLTAVRPEHLHETPELPRPSLARLVEGGRAVASAGRSGQPLELVFAHAPLTLDFTGLVFDAPDRARFRYRLDPAAPYRELGSRRTLILDRLPVGEHRLELRVDNDERGAARELLRLRVAPPLYATWTFRIAITSLTLLLLALIYLWRVREINRQRHALAAEVAARTRELRAQKEALEATAEALAGANARLRTLSTIDPLTGLPNRRALMERIEHRLRAPLAPLALALIDLDHFKRINDSHGHLAGDAVLRDFAALADGHLRGEQTLGRWGGEEFLALLPDIDAAAALAWVERLLAQVRTRRVAIGEATVGYRLSVGIALSAAGDDADLLIARADRALYRAKDEGRDRAVCQA